MPFRAFNLGDNLYKAIEEAGYTEPTPIQLEAIPKIMAGHDLIGIAQTGTPGFGWPTAWGFFGSRVPGSG